MRIRCNFTIEFDVDDYRSKYGDPNDSKVKIRDTIQAIARDHVIEELRGEGVKVTYLGQNNRYDPETRQTIHEEYVNA